MLKHATFLAISLGLATPVFAQSADTVVATVDGVDITLGEMIITRAQLPQQYEQFPADVLFQGILDQLVQQQLLAKTISEPPARVELTLKNERRSLLAGEAITAIGAATVTEDALRAAYEDRFEGLQAETEWNASHLLVETEEEAAAAKARVDGGEEFADVARDVSTGPTGPNGGNLGWFGPGRMVPAFEIAVSEMEVGDVSDPIQTQFGWHIVTLNDKRLQEQPGFDAMREELAAELREAAITETLDQLQRSATIALPEPDQFDPNILTDLTLLEP